MIGFSAGFDDRIYEAGAIPELWPSVLRELMLPVEARGAVLISKNGDEISWASSSDDFAEIAHKHYQHPRGSERTSRLLSLKYPGFLTDLDLWSSEEISTNELYNDFLIPNGMGRAIATAIHSVDGVDFIVHSEGPASLGSVPRNTIELFDSIRPHLARAAILSKRIARERVNSVKNILDQLGIPAVILSRGAKILAISECATYLIPGVIQDRLDRARFVDKRLDRLFFNSFQKSSGSGVFDDGMSFPAIDERDLSRLVAHIVPLRRSAHDVFGSGAAVLLFTPVRLNEVAGANIIAGLFDLTPAEARVGKLVGEGFSVKEIAQRLKLTEGTTRVYVKKILSKIGIGRQSELVGLLQGTSFGPSGRVGGSRFDPRPAPR